jgi:hypothetical protein
MTTWDVLGRRKTVASERTSLPSYGKLGMSKLERVWSTTLAT